MYDATKAMEERSDKSLTLITDQSKEVSGVLGKLAKQIEDLAEDLEHSKAAKTEEKKAKQELSFRFP